MKYILINRTKISNKKLRKIINFSCPKGLSDFRITVRYCRNDYHFDGFGGGQYKSCTVGINRMPIFPFSSRRGAKWVKFGYIDNSIIKNNDELLILQCSHELRHVWQDFVSKQNHRGMNKKTIDEEGKESKVEVKMEKDASKYCRKKLLEWRKSTKI
jgi:hypothetical protein